MIGWALWRFFVLRSRKRERCVHERICGTRLHRRYERLSFDASRCANVPMDVMGGFPSTFLCIGRILGHSGASWRIGRLNDRLEYGHWNRMCKGKWINLIVNGLRWFNGRAIATKWFTGAKNSGVKLKYRKQSTVY